MNEIGRQSFDRYPFFNDLLAASRTKPAVKGFAAIFTVHSPELRPENTTFVANPLIYLKRICITGPESSGKTTLATSLAAHYRSFRLEETARPFLEQLGRPYREEDLLTIAQTQRNLEIRAETNPEGFISAQPLPDLYFADTGLEVIKIWSEVRFGRAHPWIAETLRSYPADLYLLCSPDLPWSFDPLREHPSSAERIALFRLYASELDQLGIPWRVVEGTGENRTFAAQRLIADFLELNF